VRAESSALRRHAAPLVLSALPMLGAALGAGLDESRALGFSTWRSVCRSADLDLASLVSFTLQLLPLAVIGLLLGGASLLVLAILHRKRASQARDCLAAHGACVLTLPAALVVCASAMPWPLMLAVDVLLTALAVLLVIKLLRPASHPPRSSLRAPTARSAAHP
jgi:hypothetical protein